MACWLRRIDECLQKGAYKLKRHVFIHAMEEGFEERHVLEALGQGKLIEAMPREERCLICGRFQWSETSGDHLHIVVDLSKPDRIEIVTAYIPRMPWWSSPFRRTP